MLLPAYEAVPAPQSLAFRTYRSSWPLSLFCTINSQHFPRNMWHAVNTDCQHQQIVAEHFWYICFFGLLASVTDGLSTYVQEPLVISRRGCTGRDLNEEMLDCVWNVMAHTQKPDSVFQRNGRVHLNRRGSQFSRLLAVEECGSAVVMLDRPCSEAECKSTGYPLHSPVSPSLPLPTSSCAIRFQLSSNSGQQASSPVRKSVAYESDVTDKWLWYFD